jgi:hypothetical protein
MTLRNYWTIHEDQWGTQLIMIKEESKVYCTYEDRKEGSYDEIYLGDLQAFTTKYINSNDVIYKEAALYIQENYLKE